MLPGPYIGSNDACCPWPQKVWVSSLLPSIFCHAEENDSFKHIRWLSHNNPHYQGVCEFGGNHYFIISTTGNHNPQFFKCPSFKEHNFTSNISVIQICQNIWAAWWIWGRASDLKFKRTWRGTCIFPSTSCEALGTFPNLSDPLIGHL